MSMISDAGVRGQGGALGAFDLLKFIDRRGLAVLPAANAFGEQILNVGVSHRTEKLKRAS